MATDDRSSRAGNKMDKKYGKEKQLAVNRSTANWLHEDFGTSHTERLSDFAAKCCPGAGPVTGSGFKQSCHENRFTLFYKLSWQ